MEHLADVLAEIVSVQRSSFFSPETIVVQNRGMQRWITLQLCDRLGIWSHCKYPFPDSFIRSLFSAVFTDIEQEPFNLGVLEWRIHKTLPDFLEQEPFSELKTYLSDSQPSKLFELSSQIANLFNQYTVYR
ncbi:MAG: exodeoxyribonuclease V subunit gamma, partial [Fibrobacter sp.]|nr:exodeoxyribonuclease V subunit gamma [Fibrobacter sp.]